MNIDFRHLKYPAVALAAAVLLQPAAFAQTAGKPMQGAMAASPSGAGGMDMMAMMKDMNEKMSSMPMTGRTDVDFAMMMRVHHQGAIDMAQAELRGGKEPQMKKMAREIISAQKKEITQIDRFLAQHGHSMDQMKK